MRPANKASVTDVFKTCKHCPLGTFDRDLSQCLPALAIELSFRSSAIDISESGRPFTSS